MFLFCEGLKIKKLSFLFVFIISCLIIGCVATSPYEKHLIDAQNSAEQKDWENSYRLIERLREETLSIGYVEYEPKALALTKKYPLIMSVGLEKAFSSDLQKLDISCNRRNIFQLIDQLITLKKYRLVDNETQGIILSRSKPVLNKCIASQASKVSLTSVYKWEADLGDDIFTVESKASAFKRQVEEAKKNPDRIDNSIQKFINSYPNSKIYLESNLPEIQWMKLAEATQIIKELFPSYYAETCKNSSIIINIKTEPKKPLLELDITEELNKYIMISAYQDNSKANYTVIVRELAYEEQNTPEQTSQKYVSSADMNVANALLCYPRNATAIYDVTTGGLVLRYAYQIDLFANDQKIESVILRDSVQHTYKRASNLRYQNVFGGVGVPDCYPNATVEQEFKTSSSPTSIESIRKVVFDEVLRKITELEHINKAALFGKKL